MGGLLHPDLSLQFSLDQGLNQGLVDTNTRHYLSKLERALLVVKNTKSIEGQQQNALPVSAAMERGLITEEEGLRILELQVHTGGLRTSAGLMITLNEAEEKRLLRPETLARLQEKLQHRELVDPNTAEQLNLYELRQRCVTDIKSGLLLPVQQPGGAVCLSSGKKVGFLCAVQEGLIDRKVAVRLLEAQLFAGGIVDPRSGHQLTVNEALQRGLIDQDLACALFARQLQNGGILDPSTGERLTLGESVHRDLLSSSLAPVVLEALWAFAGMLWPESGQAMPIVEALQQGIISVELSKNILRHRHVIGALYNPDTLQLLPLTQATEQHLDPNVVLFLKGLIIPDVLTCSVPPSLSLLPSGSPEAISHTVASAHFKDPKDELKHRLLSHLVAHSYVDAHTGKRLLLLDPELNEMVKANLLLSEDLTEPPMPSTYEQGNLKILEQLNSTDKVLTEVHPEAGQQDSPEFSESKESKMDTGILEETNKSLYSHSPTLESERKVSRGIFDADYLASHKKLEGPKLNSSCPYAGRKNEEEEEELILLKDPISQEAKSGDVSSAQFQYNTGASSQNETVKAKESVSITPTSNIIQSAEVKESQDMELEKLARELKQEGLLNLDGNKLLPDEAVAQGLLSGYMVVKIMAEASLFGGFVDGISGKSLTMDDATQDLLDDDLMWKVLKSDKILSGVVDVDKNQVYSITEASRTGLIDPNTASRLLEAQVVSGGIVDLRKNEKVSVATAANLGLIEESQKEELTVLESACKGKKVDSVVMLTKASLQLQIDGVVDPESKSPVPLEQAIQNKLIRPDEAYQVLIKQVAEGGIVHHASGLRLSVSDAIDRGLVNRSVACGLQELEWVFKGKISPSSNPEAFILQASTGAILDPVSGCKLTLTEAVSKGLLDDSVADKAMTSSVVTHGVLDPQSARIVPFSELVKQGKIDIKTGQRFLAVKPFRGIQDEKTGVKMTFPEAIASMKVDPIPSFRLLENQANSGGIVDVTTGERLSLFEACKRGLIEDNVVRSIATSQFLKGGIVDPVSGKQFSNLDDAVAKGLISSQIALDVLEKTASMKVKDDDAVEIGETDSVGKHFQAHTDKDSVKAATVDKKECSPSDDSKICRYHEPDDRNVTVFLAEGIRDKIEREDSFVRFLEVGKGDMAEQDDVNVKEKHAKAEITFSVDDEFPDQRQTSPINAMQSKRKKKDKKKKKEAQLNRKDISSQLDQVDTHIEGQSDANGASIGDFNSNDKCKKSHINSQTANTFTPNQEDDANIDINIAGNNLVNQADLATLKYTEHAPESQRDQVKAAVANNKEKGKSEELKKEEKKDESEEKLSVSLETEHPQTFQPKKRNKVDLPQKHPDDEKAALILKTKESVLKKVFVKGVSEKQTVAELQTLRNEQHPTVQGVKSQTLSSALSGEGNPNDRRNGGRKHQRSSQFPNAMLSKESKLEPAMGKDDVALQQVSEEGATDTVSLKTPSKEQERKGSPKEDVQKNVTTDQPVQSKGKNKESSHEKQSKKNKKKRPEKKLLPPENVDSDEVVISTTFVVEQTDLDKSAYKHTDDQSASDKIEPALVDESNKTVIIAQSSWHSPSDVHQPEESTSQIKGDRELAAFISTGQEQFDEDTLKSEIQVTTQSVGFGAKPDKTTGDEGKTKTQQPPEGSSVPEIKAVESQKQNSECFEMEEYNSVEYESTNPECDTADTDSWEEDDVKERDDLDSNTRTSKIRKVTSLFIDSSLYIYSF